jgi:hypothetical protein
LADLVLLGLAVDFLKVLGLRNVVMDQNVVAAAGPRELETEGACKLEKVMEWQILGTVQRFAEQFVKVHGDLDRCTFRDQSDSSFDPSF